MPEAKERREKASQHFRERGIHAKFFDGVHAEKMGIKTVLPYERDNPGSGFNMGFRCTGCWLSHFMLWSALNMMYEDAVVICEDDVKWHPDWHERFSKALGDVPQDWDMIWVGSCCTADKPKTLIAGDVYDCRYPLCTHAYCVAKKALPTILQTQRDARVYAPLDCSLVFHTFPKLKVYTILPRLCDQWDTVIND